MSLTSVKIQKTRLEGRNFAMNLLTHVSMYKAAINFEWLGV